MRSPLPLVVVLLTLIATVASADAQAVLTWNVKEGSIEQITRRENEIARLGPQLRQQLAGGLPEIVGSEVGGLFRPADPQDQASVVVGLLKRSDLAALGAEARTRVVDRWSNARLAARHLEIYEDVIRRRRSA